MALNLYPQTVHKIEYGYGNFNYDIESVNSFLYNECPSFNGNDDDIDFATYINVLRADLQDLVKRMEANKSFYEDKVPAKGYSVDDFIRVINEWIKTSDQDNETVYLEWF